MNFKAEEILEVGFTHEIIATGAKWRIDGIGRSLWQPILGYQLPHVFTPEDILDGVVSDGRVVIYDDDHYYMGSLLAELLSQLGCSVSLVTPAPLISYWSQYTLEQDYVQRRLMNMGVQLLPQHLLHAILDDNVILSHAMTGIDDNLSADAIVLVTDRWPNDSLYRELKPTFAAGRLDSLRVIGDAEAPNLIAQAVFSGHLAGREFEETITDGTPFRIERVEL